jgi:HD-like signal output (HDOD) protein
MKILVPLMSTALTHEEAEAQQHDETCAQTQIHRFQSLSSFLTATWCFPKHIAQNPGSFLWHLDTTMTNAKSHPKTAF